MKIIKIEHVDTKNIGGSIQDVIEIFNIIYEDGTINKFKISLWYVPKENLYSSFLSSLKMNKFTYPISNFSNLDKLYEMVIKEFKKLGYLI